MSKHRILLTIALLIPLAILAINIQAQQSDEAEQGDQIFGNALAADWTISVNGTSGTFVIDNHTWNIDFFQETPGLNGFRRLLSFFGREPDNFIRLDVFMDDVGTDFLVFYYDYQENILLNQRFEGSYRVGTIVAQPNFVDGYLPLAEIPTYINPENAPSFEGEDFVISSSFTEVSPKGGTVDYQGLQLQVFPVLNVVISSTWSEFWSVGVDVNTCKSYFIQFYRTQSSFIIDLESGNVITAPLGRAELLGGDVSASRDFNLASQCQ